MLNEDVINNIVDVLVRRIERVNTYTIKKIAENIAKIGDVIPSQAQDLANILKYGGDYEKIINEIAKITNLNVQEIDDIFEKVAKKNQQFAKRFYDYRNVPYTPYEKNKALQDQVEAIKNITKQTYVNMSNTLGFAKYENGNLVFNDLATTYQNTLDDAVLSLFQGKDAFNSAMARTIKELSASGLKTIDYASGYHRRLDSSVRMNLQGALRDLSINLQQQFGSEYGADGVEISVHENPAIDHENVQGHQFNNSEFANLQSYGVAKDYKENLIDIHIKKKDGTLTSDFRPIGQLNCYHYVYSIVLGIDDPQYSENDLKMINERNHKGFELDGKHYTMYQGTQMQRKLETKIRSYKDELEGLKSANLDTNDVQGKITQTTNKYFELCQKSGLKPKLERLKVEKSASTRIEIPKVDEVITPKQDKYTFTITKEQQLDKFNLQLDLKKQEIKTLKSSLDKDLDYMKTHNIDINSGYSVASLYRVDKNRLKKLQEEVKNMGKPEFEDKTIKLTDYDSCKELLGYANIEIIDDKMKTIDNQLLLDNTAQLYNLTNKYTKVRDELARRGVKVKTITGSRVIASTNSYELNFNKSMYNNYDTFINNEARYVRVNWSTHSYEENLSVHSITHEFGHLTQRRLADWYSRNRHFVSWKDFDKMTMESIYGKAKKTTGLSITELKNQYLSDYGKSKRNFEAFAEIFAQLQDGKSSPLTDAMQEYLEEVEQWKK